MSNHTEKSTSISEWEKANPGKKLFINEMPPQKLSVGLRKFSANAFASVDETKGAAAGMTKQQMIDRISLLSSEMDANDDENRIMQAEINTLYAKIDETK